MNSTLKEIGPVPFPEHTGERIYMLPFFQQQGLPSSLSRWQPTIDLMLKDVITERPIYLMIDQGIVKAGNTHRRPRPHIDGNWIAETNSHGASPNPRHRPIPTHSPWPTHNTQEWAPEALILASDISACCAYVGEVDGLPSEEGDCSHLDLSDTMVIPFKERFAYMGNITMIHESLPVAFDCQRTVVRLNCPGVEF